MVFFFGPACMHLQDECKQGSPSAPYWLGSCAHLVSWLSVV